MFKCISIHKKQQKKLIDNQFYISLELRKIEIELNKLGLTHNYYTQQWIINRRYIKSKTYSFN